MAEGLKKKAKGGKKGRKKGRNKDFCLAYALTNQREKNRMKRVKRHLARFPMDAAAVEHLARFKKVVEFGNATRSKP